MFNMSTAVRNARAQVLITALDAAAGAGEVRIYSGTKPAAGAALSGNTLLGTIALSDPSGVVANGVVTFGSFTDDISADADGTITWARFVDGDGAFVADCDCGVAGSNAALIFNAVTVTNGGVIRILSGTGTEGNS